MPKISECPFAICVFWYCDCPEVRFQVSLRKNLAAGKAMPDPETATLATGFFGNDKIVSLQKPKPEASPLSADSCAPARPAGGVAYRPLRKRGLKKQYLSETQNPIPFPQ